MAKSNIETEMDASDLDPFKSNSTDDQTATGEQTGEATEEQENKYEELRSKPYGDSKLQSDDFLTWLLIKLGIIEPKDLDENGVVKKETLKYIYDNPTEFDKRYEKYTGKEAPEDISNLSDKDKKKMEEEVKNRVNGIADKIVEYKINSDSINEQKFKNELESILLPNNPDEYEKYIKAIQVRANNSTIDMKTALEKVNTYKLKKPPKKPVFYKAAKFFHLLGKKGREYEKYEINERIEKEKEEVKSLMKKGTYGDAEEVEKNVVVFIEELENDGKINEKEAKTLRTLNIKASGIYKAVIEEYKKNNGGKEPDSVEQTKIYEKSFALAVAAKENARSKKKGNGFSYSKKGAIRKLSDKIKIINKEHEIGYRRFKEGCEISSKINAKNIARNIRNNKMDNNAGKPSEENNKGEKENSNNKGMSLEDQLSEIEKYKEKKQKAKKRINSLSSKEKKFAHREDKLLFNDSAKKEALKASRVVGGAKNLNRFTAIKALKNVADENKDMNEKFENHMKNYKNRTAKTNSGRTSSV